MSPVFRNLTLLFSFLFAGLPLRADWKADIGHTQLADELGAALPTGAGVTVIMTEAPFGAGDPYLPQAQPGADSTFAGTGTFTGTTFVNVTESATGISGHASTVGRAFFGAESVAGDIPLVYCYSAASWINEGFLFAELNGDVLSGGPQELPAPGVKVISAAWIATSGPLVNRIRRVDFVVERDGLLIVGGLGNGSGAVPSMLGPSYNALIVGRTDGTHSINGVPAGNDGPGRTRPDLVMPAPTTSEATGQLSSVAAFLYEVAQSPGLEDASNQPEMMKAILMAGATKDEFAHWSRTEAMPLDPVFGAGETNLANSYHILVGGPVSGSDLPLSGWHYRPNLSVGDTATYSFTIPAHSRARKFTVSLNWNRKVSPDFASFVLPDLDLALYRETVSGDELMGQSASQDGESNTYNLEYLYEENLPPGDYRLEISHVPDSPAATDFGLAWITEEGPPPSLTPDAEVSSDDILLSLDGLREGMTFSIEYSDDLIDWYPLTSVVASSEEESVPLADELLNHSTRFYRMLW